MTNEINEVEEVVVKKPSLFGMIMNPTEQFDRIRKNPKIIVALLLVTILTTIGMALMLQTMDFESSPELVGFSEEELMFAALIGQITFVVVGVFTPVFVILISTIVFIIIAKIVRSEVSFKQLFSMNTYIFMISALSFIVNGLAFLVVGNGNPEIYFTSLNSIINAEGVAGAFLNSIEVFSIWGLIITAIGLQVVARFSKGLSWAVVIGFYIVSLIFAMAGAAFSTMFGM